MKKSLGFRYFGSQFIEMHFPLDLTTIRLIIFKYSFDTLFLPVLPILATRTTHCITIRLFEEIHLLSFVDPRHSGLELRTD